MITKHEVSTKLHQGLISLIVPAFNEEENLPALIHRLRAVMAPYGSYEILVVDDGSSDQTRHVLRELSSTYPVVRFIALGHNFGYRMALRAGYEHARGEAVICLDADLQHPPELIPALIEKWRDGYDVVNTVREFVPDDPELNRAPAGQATTLPRPVPTVLTGGKATHFRLLDRNVVDCINQSEATITRRNAGTGFRRCRIGYQPAARYAGRSACAVPERPRSLGAGSSLSSARWRCMGALVGFGAFSTVTLFGSEFVYMYTATKVPAMDWAALAQLMVLGAGAQLMLTGLIGRCMNSTFRLAKHQSACSISDTSDRKETVIGGSREARTEYETHTLLLMYRSLVPPRAVATAAH